MPAVNSGIILGRDFLSRNQFGITWGPEGKLQLRDEQDLSVQTTEEMTSPTVKLAAKTVIPPPKFGFGHSFNNIAPM